MSFVRCGKCSLIVEASPRPPRWRCPNCRELNAVGPLSATPLAAAVEPPSVVAPMLARGQNAT
jgi:hypothetical protein